MGTYRQLYNIRIEHEYFDGNVCRAMQCCISPSGQDLWHRRGLLFRQVGINEWTILYDDAGAGVDTHSDALALELVMTDPAFVLYTQWCGFQPFSAYLLELPVLQETLEAAEVLAEQSSGRQMGTGFCRIQLRLTEEVLLSAWAGTPQSVCLLFYAPECRWEYLFIPRSGDSILSQTLRLEESGGKLTFDPFEAVTEYDRELLRTVSHEKIPMREHYDFRFRLISAIGGNDRPGQVLLRNVATPKPGVYLNKKPELLRQLCYF